MKKLLTILLVVIAISGAVMALRNQKTESGEVATAGTQTVPAVDLCKDAPEHVVKVTYFTTAVRCPSCRRIEELTRQTVENRFTAEVARGVVVFQLINTDLPGNEHFLKDYQLVSKTVVVAEFDNEVQGDWVNLQDVWLKFTDPEAFADYVSAAVNSLL